MSLRISRFLALLVVLGCAGHTQSATTPGPMAPIKAAYHVAMPDPASHLYEIQIDLDDLRGDTVALQMPVWSTGRYARVDFARNVQDFLVTDGSGSARGWTKANGSLWQLSTGGARQLRVRYRVFANNLSGTYSVLDTAHANWNGAGLFMYAVDHKPDPVTLTIAPPAGWLVINGDAKTPGQTSYSFENYDRLVDTPTEVAPAAALQIDTFTVDGRLYRTVIHHNGPAAAGARERVVAGIRRIVATENRVIAPPPLAMYTFIANIGYEGSDGMEHLYSTELISPRAWTDLATADQFLSLASHEYFHTWNVKRIRPSALGPFDYTREQYQPSLWVAEGWTNYYGNISPMRAGVQSKADYYANIGGTIGFTSTTPARKERSARMASFDAPFFDGAVPPMRTNRSEVFLTYYVKGEVLALALDLKIRSATSGSRSLDDVLRLLKQRTWDAPNASYYLQGRGYTEADVERAASDVFGSDLHPWFERYVGGTDDLPWNEILSLAGLRLRIAGDPRQATLEEVPDATAEQRAVREGWLKGP